MLSGPTGPPPPSRLRTPCCDEDGFVSLRDFFNGLLGLEQTSFDDVLRPLPNRSRRYSYYHPWTYAESEELYFVPVWDYSFNSGGGNLVSTADELAKFGESLAELESLTLDDFELLLGWSSELDSRGRRRLFVSGSNPGVQAALAVYPEDGLAVAVLANTWGVGSRSGEMVRLASSVAETLFEGS